MYKYPASAATHPSYRYPAGNKSRASASDRAESKMWTPPAASVLVLALSASVLLLAASVAADGYGGSTGPTAGANNGGGERNGSGGSSGYGGDGGKHDASTGPKAGGSYQQEPPYRKPVDGLKFEYYAKSCPDMEGIVQRAVKKAVGADYTLAASLIRLFFHDFAVRGTDASILIDVPDAARRSEKYAAASRALRGFDLIESIKSDLEARCRATVSCADVLAAAARDAAVEARVSYWRLRYGRRDGKQSRAAEADRLVPMGGQSVTDLLASFESTGLTALDLVALSGAHTIGRATCGAVRPGLCARREKGSLERRYADFLQRRCAAGGDGEHLELDGETPTAFDNQYYKNLMRGMGLLDTDQKLLDDSRTGPFVRMFANQAPEMFTNQFALSMQRLGEVKVLTGNEGEVRRKCSAVNY